MIQIQNRNHLIECIEQSIKLSGNHANLNHFDVSGIENFSCVFYGLDFQGDISQWNTANAVDMTEMFKRSSFNGDISKWNIGNTIYFTSMFESSRFRGDLSTWRIEHCRNVDYMFLGCFEESSPSLKLPEFGIPVFMPDLIGYTAKSIEHWLMSEPTKAHWLFLLEWLNEHSFENYRDYARAYAYVEHIHLYLHLFEALDLHIEERAALLNQYWYDGHRLSIPEFSAF